jgi:hypothetical protein
MNALKRVLVIDAASGAAYAADSTERGVDR